ncbi:hypothetical protein Tco_1460037 [Tanacetum coccineum]
MESIKKEAHLIKVQWNGANKYQVSGSLGDQCVVDVKPTVMHRQPQQAELVVGHDGSGGLGVGVVIGLSIADGAGDAGVGVGSQCSSHSRWTKRIVQTERSSLQKKLLLNL